MPSMSAASDQPIAGTLTPKRGSARWRPLASLALAVAMVAWVFSRIDWDVFVAELTHLRYGPFLAFMLTFVVALLSCDVLATGYIYRSTVAPIRFRELFVVRGASYLPSLINHHVGQAWITYYLARIYGVSLARVAGATLIGYATWAGCMLLLGTAGMWAAGFAVGWVIVPVVLGLGYLAILHARPRALVSRRLLSPLFEAGVGGHIRAMFLRLPHAAVLFIGTWVPFLFFGVEIPFGAALVYVPILMVAVTVPITPQGIGTRDALAATFFQGYALAQTEEGKLAAIAAATATTVAAITLIDVVLGLLLLPGATRLIRAGERASAS
jgi:hypothetical protein